MRKFIFDTDIGGDSDDVVALVLLANAHRKKEIDLLGVTISSSAKEGATCCRAILKSIGMEQIPISVWHTERSEKDWYGGMVTNKFPELSCPEKPFPNVLPELRRMIAENPGVELIVTGTLQNIRDLLLSQPDEISPLNGVELVRQNVPCMWAMAGNFAPYNNIISSETKIDENGKPVPAPEWNLYGMRTLFGIEGISQDAISLWPTDIVFIPWEVGVDVLSGKKLTAKGEDYPAGYALIAHGFPNGRCSWDPMTAYYAVYGGDWLTLSEYGTVTVDKDYYSIFTPNPKGKHRIPMKLNRSNEEIAELIEAKL